MRKSIKRHDSLKPLSRDHHHGLLLCWKIREGLKKKIAEDRIKKYNDFFFTSQLIPHFDFEEEEVFPLLGNDHPLVQQALAEHGRLKELFAKEDDLSTVFLLIEKELQAHIRFEERVLFAAIQEKTSDKVLEGMTNKEEEIKTPDPDDWNDPYWERRSGRSEKP